MRADFDALIIGAGPAGSAAAILLARAGWSVALVEKHSFPRRKVCGECIAASNLPLLEALGLGAALLSAAGPELRRVALMRGNSAAMADLPAAAGEQWRWGRALGRETLDTLLTDQARCAGAVVLQPWRVKSIDGGPGDWRCEARCVNSGRTLALRARVAIDAHGSWEGPPSGLAARRMPRRGADLLAFKANFRHATLEDGLLPVLSFDGGYGGMVLAGDGLTTVACCIRRDQLAVCRQASPAMSAGDAVQALLMRQCAGVRTALRGAIREGPWLAAGPLAPGIRIRGSDTLFRIGNAAGEAHPIIGEGISMALQSAWLLCGHLLAPGHTGPIQNPAWQRDVAQRYNADWRRHFTPRLRLAAAFAHVAMRPALALPLTALAQAWPGLLKLGAAWSGKARFCEHPTKETI